MNAGSSGGVFVTGTDTGVGKTFVSCYLLREARRLGHQIGVMKPVETGVGIDGPEDAASLGAASGSTDPPGIICPQRFALPAAPDVAATAEGKEVDLGAIDDAWRTLSGSNRLMLVEGAGGLRVPLSKDIEMADLAQRLELPLLIVARASLGTINHTLLTLESAQKRGLALRGVVINRVDGPLSDPDRANLGCLKRELGSLLLGELAFQGPGQVVPAGLLPLGAIWPELA